MNPELSIIIPTRNRQYYCLSAIKQILALNLNSFEICIQDNSDTNSLFNDILQLNNEHIVYHYHEGVLSFVDNFSEAVSLCSGQYVCMIGDDDGIMKDIEDVLIYAKAHNIDAIIPSIDFAYYWPTDKPLVPGAEKGYLLAPKRAIDAYYKKVTPSMAKLLDNAGQDYQLLNLPRLYHGLVKKDVLDCIKKKTGVLFDGLTPDIYIAAALLIVCKNVYSTNMSITISGVCPTSGSADSDTGRHTGKLSDAPHFRGHAEYHWKKEIPYVYSIETIWAETLLHVLDNFNLKSEVGRFNIPLLDAICRYKHPQLQEEVDKHATEYGISHNKMALLYWKYWISHMIPRITNRLKRDLGIAKKVNKFYDVSDILVAHELITKL